MELVLDIRRGGWRLVGALTDGLEPAGAYEAALAGVSPHRRDKAQAYRFAKDRRLSLLAALLIDELLAERGLRERDMAYCEGEDGRPAFAGFPDLQFSVAHSERMAVAALSQAPVGVDVEHMPSFPRDLAEPFAWTEMESVGKLLGCGVGAFIDAGDYRRPAGVTVNHVPLADYLVCIASAHH